MIRALVRRGPLAFCVIVVVGVLGCSASAPTPAPERFFLTIDRGGTGGGRIVSSPAGIDCGVACAASFAAGTTLTLTATPDASATFDGWSGACNGMGPCAVTLSADAHVTASFTRRQATLTVHRSGPGAVFSFPPGIGCGPECVAAFDVGTAVSLEALPEPGATFSRWSGACSGTGACTVSLDAVAEVDAVFVPQTVTVDVTLAGAGAGRVASHPAGIACGSTCAAAFPEGATVVLEALPEEGSRFAGWSGDCAGAALCLVSADVARHVTARFDPIPTHALHVTLDGDGTVVSSSGGVACPSACAATYADGAGVVLQAVPPPGARFAGWSGDCSGTAACVVTMTDDRAVTATFVPEVVVTHALHVAVTGDGAVVSAPGRISCGTACDGVYRDGDSVILSAVPAPGSDFAGWSGACVGSGLCALQMSADLSVTASFRTGGSTTPNPVPSLQSLSPNTVVQGATGVSVTINGFGFTQAATVFVGANARPTTFVSATRMVVALDDADLVSGRTWSITVGNPTPGGGLSNALNLTISNPVPVLTSLDPPFVLAGAGPVTVAVNGSGFAPGSSILFDSGAWDTTYVSPTRLTATLQTYTLASARTMQATVRTFAPGGGTSAALPFAIRNPLPTIASISPASLTALDPVRPLSIRGTGFVASSGSSSAPASTVRINGQTHASTFVSATELKVTLTPADLATAGTAQVTVFNALPGGGESAPAPFVVAPRAPRITSTSPASVSAGASAFTLEVVGEGFKPTSVVTWAGVARATTYVSAQRLRIDVAASDVTAPGAAALVVTDPTGGAATPTFGFPITATSPSVISSLQVPLTAKDLAWDPVREVVYAAIGSTAPAYANQVVVLNPSTGAIVETIPVGSDPSHLAIAGDASRLYMALDGAAKIQRVDLTTRFADLSFPVGLDTISGGVLWAAQLDVAPDAPSIVAVARASGGGNTSVNSAGLSVYDDGVARPAALDWTSRAQTVTFTSSESLFSWTGSSFSGLLRLTLGPTGVVNTQNAGGLNASSADMLHDSGRLYASNGQVFEIDGSVAGTCPVNASAVRPDVAHGRIFYLSGPTLLACNAGTFTTMGSVQLGTAAVSGARFVRFGSNGIAYRTATQVVFVRTTLIGG